MGSETWGQGTATCGDSGPRVRMNTLNSNIWKTNRDRNFLIPNIALDPTQNFSVSLASPRSKQNNRTPRKQSLSPANYVSLAGAAGFTLSPGQLPATDTTFVLYMTMTTDELDAAKPKGQINHTSWTIDNNSVPLIATKRKNWDQKLLVPWTGKESKWVEVVVNNEDVTGHPFHLVRPLTLLSLLPRL
jgi:FtsP/CotA-like multicopper oxidase with cupredoxin domain